MNWGHTKISRCLLTCENSFSSSLPSSTPAFSSISSIILISWTASCLPLGFLDAQNTNADLAWPPTCYFQPDSCIISGWCQGFLVMGKVAMKTTANAWTWELFVWPYSDGKTRSFCSASCSWTVNALQDTHTHSRVLGANVKHVGSRQNVKQADSLLVKLQTLQPLFPHNVKFLRHQTLRYGSGL